jgi:hypothetical protein
VTGRSYSLARAAWALFCGLLAGVTLVTAYHLLLFALTSSVAGENLLSPSGLALVSAVFSLAYGLLIALICMPLWLLAARTGLARPASAATLGFIATFGWWIAFTYPPSLSTLGWGLPYALSGAVAGLVTWWIANPRL